MLVTVALIDDDQVSDDDNNDDDNNDDQGANVGGWRTLDGILTEVNSAGISIGLNNLSGWVLDSFLGVTHTGSVRVMKWSKERLYTNSVEQLRELLEAEINLDALPQAEFIFGSVMEPKGSLCLCVRPSVWHNLV